MDSVSNPRIDALMEKTTELRNVKRGFLDEFSYRMSWLYFGVVACIVVAFIPVVGWAVAVGMFALVLWKTFGLRETQVVGSCPVCTQSMLVKAKTYALACPGCRHCLIVKGCSLMAQ